MSHQGEEGWYPECIVCNSGNLGSEVVCKDCYNKLKKEVQNNENKTKILEKRATA